MAHRADERQPIGPPRQKRQMLAESHSRNGGGNRLERPANLRRSLGLRIPHIEMGRPAQQIDEDAVLRPRPARPHSDRSSPRQPRQTQPREQSPAAYVDKLRLDGRVKTLFGGPNGAEDIELETSLCQKRLREFRAASLSLAIQPSVGGLVELKTAARARVRSAPADLGGTIRIDESVSRPLKESP